MLKIFKFLIPKPLPKYRIVRNEKSGLYYVEIRKCRYFWERFANYWSSMAEAEAFVGYLLHEDKLNQKDQVVKYI